MQENTGVSILHHPAAPQRPESQSLQGHTGLNAKRRLAAVCLIPLFLGACGSLVKDTPQAPAGPRPLPFDEPPPVKAELDSDLVYSVLAADIAAQRGELALAYSHYMHAAKIAGDARSAERATRIAVYLRKLDDALAAARRWVQLAPNSQDARMSLALLLERSGDRPGALAEIDALLRIAEALEHDGFLQVAQVLGKERSTDTLGLMQAVVDAHAGDPRAYYGYAVVALARQQFAAAEGALRQALERKPDWPQAQVLLARARLGQGDRAGALAGLDKAVKSNPDSVLLRTARGRLLVDIGDHEGALKDFRRLLRSEPDNSDYLYAVAMLSTQTERYGEARKAWQELRSRGGDKFQEATYFLAQVEERTDHPDAAAGLYRSVDRGDLVVDAGLRLAAIEAGQGSLVQARERLQRLRQSHPDRAVDAWMTEARLLREADQSDAAAQLLAKAVAASPDDLSLRYGRAMQAARLKDYATMEADLRFILEREPEHVDALNALGYTLADRNERLDEAETLIGRALALKPDNAAILDSMGWLRFRQGRMGEALDYLRRAYDKLPDPEIAAHLGEVLWANGDHAAARKVWGDSLNKHPDNEVLLDALRRHP